MDDDLSPAARRLRKKQAIERWAVELGEERTQLEEDLLINRQSIMDREREALDVGIPVDAFARLVGISRQTLYRWRERAAS
jgi:DNA-binding XRE family transcriptional regulator